MTFVKGQPRPVNAGRKKGVPNKVTQERSARIEEAEKKTGRRLAIDRLAEAVDICFGMAAKYQDGMPTADKKEFKYWMHEGMWGTINLANYQSAKMQATTLQGPGAGGEFLHRLEIEIIRPRPVNEITINGSVRAAVEHKGEV